MLKLLLITGISCRNAKKGNNDEQADKFGGHIFQEFSLVKDSTKV